MRPVGGVGCRGAGGAEGYRGCRKGPPLWQVRGGYRDTERHWGYRRSVSLCEVCLEDTHKGTEGYRGIQGQQTACTCPKWGVQGVRGGGSGIQACTPYRGVYLTVYLYEYRLDPWYIYIERGIEC